VTLAPINSIVSLYRNGVNGFASLGASQGVLSIEFEATDRLGRTTTATRCWEQELLAAPIAMGTAAAAATDGPVGSNKLGFAGLDLADTTVPIAPVSMMFTAVAPTTPAGAGLFEFPIYNPTNESVYVSIDIDVPPGGTTTTATWGKSHYDGKWVYRDAATNTACGSVCAFDPDVGLTQCYPDEALPGCSQALPAGGSPTATSASGNLLQSDFSVRTWTTDQMATTLIELAPCPGCSSTPAGAQRNRITVLVPPRAIGNVPPLKIWIMPVVRPSIAFQPGVGPYAEFTVGSFTLSGRNLGTQARCIAFSPAPPRTTAPAGGFRCTTTRTYTLARYAKSLSIGNVGSQTAQIFTGSGPTNEIVPPHLVTGSANVRLFSPVSGSWNTMESTEPPAL
jgi:hypothetical protein